MIFIDGVGIGKPNPEFNPFFKYGFKTFTEYFGDIPILENQILKNGEKILFPTDARLGVEGLPQSGTGQVSIFCGVNAPKFVGKHFGPFPYSTTIPIIRDKNIFKTIADLGLKVSFVNAFPQVFFDYLNSGRQRLSVTSKSCTLSGIKLNTIDELREGKALTAEITNERWNKILNYDIPIISPQEAAKRLLNIAEENDYTLYEYFLTDHLGHWRYIQEIEPMMRNLDEFLFHLLTNINDEKMNLLICSDHGNFEDLSVKTHTLNPSITITNSNLIFEEVKNLSEIKDAVIKHFR